MALAQCPRCDKRHRVYEVVVDTPPWERHDPTRTEQVVYCRNGERLVIGYGPRRSRKPIKPPRQGTQAVLPLDGG